MWDRGFETLISHNYCAESAAYASVLRKTEELALPSDKGSYFCGDLIV